MSGSDHIPKGSIALKDAFVRFECERFDGDPPWAFVEPPDERDLLRLKHLAEVGLIATYLERAQAGLSAALTSGELKVFVRPPHSRSRVQLDPRGGTPCSAVPFVRAEINVPTGH